MIINTKASNSEFIIKVQGFLKTIAAILIFAVVIGLYYILNSASALKEFIPYYSISILVCVALSILIFIPASFFKSLRKYVSKWFYFVSVIYGVSLFLNFRYVMLESEQDVYSSRFPSLIMILISTFRAIVEPGIEVYFPFISTIFWMVSSFLYAEWLDGNK